MEIYLGIDIGAISIKACLMAVNDESNFLSSKLRNSESFFQVKVSDHNLDIWFSKYRRIFGSPRKIAKSLIEEITTLVGAENIKDIKVTGSGGRILEKNFGISRENEFSAIAKGSELLLPDVRTILEIGGEGSKYISLQKNEQTDKLSIADYELSGDCAAGTGSFIDQQAVRLKFEVEEISDVVKNAKRTPVIAGRCSVFAKSDMIHAQQKGFEPSEILKGLCEAVARNYKSCIAKGKEINPKVAFIGAVSQNLGVANAIKESFELSDEEFIVPDAYAWLGALGVAVIAAESSKEKISGNEVDGLLANGKNTLEKFKHHEKLCTDNVMFLRDQVSEYIFEDNGKRLNTYLGIDVGSVSTNFALIDEKGNMVKEIYTRTKGRPVEVVKGGLLEIEKALGKKIRIKGVGTTGSGRELIGEFVGADTVNDEITAHKTGSSFISDKMKSGMVDTIFEIGGQDSKYIHIKDGVVIDFAMNEACAAGTGSFLEEQAGKLDVNIKGEFSDMAMSSDEPIRLGERCTVFMERDVNSFVQKGAETKDVLAGLAYSIALNYLNRVVGNRHVGDVIYFQGGTAYNDSVAAAFSMVLGKKIIVPPHNGVLGALGQALIVKEMMSGTSNATKFRGFDLNKVKYTMREFGCKACTNNCDIQEFTIDGEKSYWGDKCSVKFRKKAKTAKKPVIDDLVAIREKLLLERYSDDEKKSGIKIGIPRAMYFFERFPFWNEYLAKLGFSVVVSSKTTKEISKNGIELTVAEPCFPIKVAHGHAKDLIDKGVDYLFVPNVLNAENNEEKIRAHMCPWGQTLPYVLRATPELYTHKDKFISPTITFAEGRDIVKKQLFEDFKKFGIKKTASDEACDAAYTVQRAFDLKLQRIGREALNKIISSGEEGIVLVGRPYNINDSGINVNIPEKLRNYYGVNVIPMDFLPMDNINYRDINPNMFWNYGKKILSVVNLVKDYPNLHIIYMTNFKCGPDSYIKHFAGFSTDRPFLTLQFDEHQNDAGYMTRCEAYLDSKGVLRCPSEQKKKKAKAAA